MNIMVFDVPAEHGGALSILNSVYEEAKDYKDKNINWIFILSNPKLKETQNVKVLNYPWIKKSWFHRLYFDYFIAPILIRKYDVDKVFSLQNITIPRTSVPQILYVHQPLPFVEYRFTLMENPLFWFYQKILSKNIFRSIKIADRVIVQTEWLKKECITKLNVKKTKIIVSPPPVNLTVENFFEDSKKNLSQFFYPSSSYSYKNHKVIVDACKALSKRGVEDYNIVFTLKGNEEKHIQVLKDEVLKYNLPIQFVGSLDRNSVFDYYLKSVLLFPSYIETFGLPMLEAKLHGTPIIASDAPFSHEILDNYSNAYFFNSFNPQELSLLMKNMMDGNNKYHKYQKINYITNGVGNSLLDYIV